MARWPCGECGFGRSVRASTQEVSEHERQYEDGSDPKLLDLIDVPLIEHSPLGHQSENWLLDPRRYWRKVDRLAPRFLGGLLDREAPLWLDGQSTYNGRNDKVPAADLKTLDDSLRLIAVDRLKLRVFAPGEVFGNPKRRVQGQFSYADRSYALWVTDPNVERGYLAKPDGVYESAACYLTISLGEPFEDACYKLIAAIIPRG